MKRRQFTRNFLIAAAISAIFVMTSQFTAQTVSESELRYREALRKQQVDGDLPAAIKLYKEIAASKTANKATKANALLQLAACYEKLGQESQAVYLQIVRDFSDQPAAMQARTKLAALRPPAPPPSTTLRKIELGAGVQNLVATDGQRALYWDPTKTILYVGDVAGKTRNVVRRMNRTAVVTASHDLSMVFFYLPELQQGPAGYAVMKTDGTGYRELKPTENGKSLPIGVVAPAVSWSWDKRYLVMAKPEPNSDTLPISFDQRILKISVADGRVVVLAGKRAGFTLPMFSPDDRFIAYREQGAVHVISSQGGEPRRIAAGAEPIRWSSDGRYLLIVRAFSGEVKIFAAPVQDGQPAGEPVLLESSSSLPRSQNLPQISANGTLIVRMNRSDGRQYFLGTIDRQDQLTWNRLNLIDTRFIDGRGNVGWSPDSRRIAYISANTAVRVRHLATGEDREVYRSSSRLESCVWAQQRPTLYCAKPDRGRTEIVAVMLDSGRAETVGFLNGARLPARTSSDDRLLLTGVPDGRQWEIGTDRESAILNPFQTSADGRWVFSSLIRGPGDRRQLSIRPTSGTESDWKPMAYPKVEGWGVGRFTAGITDDGNWLFYRDRDAGGKDGLYRVSTSGGEPERVGDYPTSQQDLAPFLISPDGRQFIVNAREPEQQPELWILENFVPSPASATKAGAKAVTK